MTCSTCASKTAAIVGPILIDATTAARACGVSRTTWLSWDAAGINPAPIRIGGRVLWSVDHLRAWAAAGCPSREQMVEIEEGSVNG